jgi:hypothetical protein
MNDGPQGDYARATGRVLDDAECAPDTEAEAEFTGFFYFHTR